jgi:hypothetical protein
MKIRSSAVVVLFALVYGESVGAQNDNTISIASVQAWVQIWSPDAKIWYAGGWRDGWAKAEAFIKYSLGSRLRDDRTAKSIVDSMLLDRDDKPILDKRNHCWLTMSNGQLEAIIDKAAKDHPEKWGEEIDNFAFDALLEACASQRK